MQSPGDVVVEPYYIGLLGVGCQIADDGGMAELDQGYGLRVECRDTAGNPEWPLCLSSAETRPEIQNGPSASGRRDSPATAMNASGPDRVE